MVLHGNEVVGLYTLSGDAVSTDSASFQGGDRGISGPIHLLFWGTWWFGQQPQINAIINMVNNVIGGSYLSQLAQYTYKYPGGITLGQTLILEPGAPTNFTFTDVRNLIWSQIDAGFFSDPQDNKQYFMVFMPQDVNQPAIGPGAHDGCPNNNILDPDVAWVGFASNGSLDFVTQVFTHEFAEMISSPGGGDALPGMVMNRLIHGNTEIADACLNTVDRIAGNGLLVQGYWSNADKACVIPLGAFTGNGPSGSQAVVGRTPGKQDLCWVAPDGSVLCSAWDSATSTWSPVPAVVAPANSALPGGLGVTVVSRTPGHLDAFWVTPNGSLASSWSDDHVNNGNWNAWAGPTNGVIPGSSGVLPGSFAAISRFPQQLDVYWIDGDGTVWGTYWNAHLNSQQWNTPYKIAPPGSARPGALEAIARIPNQVDVFWLGFDATVQTAWWNAAANGGKWNAPKAIFSRGQAGNIGAAANGIVATGDANTSDAYFVLEDGSIGHLHDGAVYPAAPSWTYGTSALAGAALQGRVTATLGGSPIWTAPDGSLKTTGILITAPDTIAPAGSALPGSVTADTRQPGHVDVYWIGPGGSVESNWKDAAVNGGGWNEPAMIYGLGAALSQNGAVAPLSAAGAVSRNSANMDVFWTSQQGAVDQNGWDPVRGWRATTTPLQVWGRGAPVGETVTAVSRQSDRLDLFWTSADGIVLTQSSVNSGNWSVLIGLAGPGSVVSGTRVAALGREAGLLDVFWTGADGSIGTDTRSLGNWLPRPGTLANPGSAMPGNPVAAVAREPSIMDLFWVGKDLSIQSLHFGPNPINGTLQWGQPFVLPGAGPGISHAPPVSGGGVAGPIAAVSRAATDVDVFWIGPNRSIMSNHFDTLSNTWGTPGGVTQNFKVSVGSPIVALSREAYHIDLFWIGSDLSVRTASWEQFPNPAWSGVTNVAPAGSAQIARPLSAVSREENRLDVFWTSGTGTVMNSFSTGGRVTGSWSTPVAISPPNAG